MIFETGGHAVRSIRAHIYTHIDPCDRSHSNNNKIDHRGTKAERYCSHMKTER